jgi:uncharacterized protein (DUF2236 family)
MPDWVKTIAEGDDVGLFGPGSAVWEVHGSMATLVGGVRALLLQAMHPAPLSGVVQHSRYQSDPLGRLIGTTRWLTLTTFASTQVIEREAKRVNAMHSKVVGEYSDKSGEERSYRASDPKYLLWVHCAFTDSFLKAHLALGYPLPQGADAYVQEWSKSAIPLGLESAPQSVSELEDAMRSFADQELAAASKTSEVVDFIRHPQFGFFGDFFYGLLVNAAISTLEPYQRAILSLPKRRKYWLRIARMMLDLFLKILGGKSPSHDLAVKRCNRVLRSEIV